MAGIAPRRDNPFSANQAAGSNSLDVVKTFQPLTREQLSPLVAKTKQAAQSGQYELFKTTAHFDSTAKHPEWLG